MKTIIVSIIGILLLGFSVIYFSEGGGMRIGRRAAEIKRHSDALAALNTKIQRYVLDHPALESPIFWRSVPVRQFPTLIVLNFPFLRGVKLVIISSGLTGGFADGSKFSS